MWCGQIRRMFAHATLVYFIQSLKRLSLLATCATVAACVTPAQRADTLATALGLSRSVAAGAAYKHLLYLKAGANEGDTLHVYIEHDGTPWLTANRVSADPTPHNLVMLNLMALDSSPAVYLGRPCYFAVEGSPPCSLLLWTHRRYAEEVVTSMEFALRSLMADKQYRRLAFFGHSGGGVLAMLLAERFPETAAIVTLGANLDTDAWTTLHGYSPLTGSLNPATRPPLPEHIFQRHYIGERDVNVPPYILRKMIASRSGMVINEVAGFDHACCWSRLWKAVLTEIDNESHELK
jgi:hypothetical protein